jgi:hypothetical protein
MTKRVRQETFAKLNEQHASHLTFSIEHSYRQTHISLKPERVGLA